MINIFGQSKTALIKSNLFFLLMMAFILLPFIKAVGQSSSPELIKKWETDTTIRTPESVLWDARGKFFYVSNINGKGDAKDGNGFISKLGADGKIIKLHWVDGLDAPKGMGMYNGELFAADLAQLVIIDIAKNKIKEKIVVPGASFLNDIVTDDRGNVYISDSRTDKVYRYYKGKVSLYIEDPLIKGANGLLVWHNLLWILSSRGICQYNPADKSLRLFSDAVKSGDGITIVNDSDLIVSRWQGEVYYVKPDGSASKILDVKAEHKNTADLFFLREKQLLVIPTFNGNRVMGYALKNR